MNNTQLPSFYGVQIYPEPQGIFRFRYATNWHRSEVEGLPGSILVSPQESNPRTWIAAWKQDIGEKVTAKDLPALRKGLDEGLLSLGTEVEILFSSEDLIDNMIRFERIVTFQQDGETHKRRIWLIFADRWQIYLIYHSESIEEYTYWLGMANYSFQTLEISEHLYYATDTKTESSEHGISVPRNGRRRKQSIKK